METATFNDVLNAIERLPLEQQADLIDVVQKRLAERGRHQIAKAAREARAEFVGGKTIPTSVDEIMREIES
jgi:hypothetical protein